MDKVHQTVGIVRASGPGQKKILLHRQSNPAGWGFIVADRLEEESFRESIIREVAWQLDLNRSSDFLVSSMAQMMMEYLEDCPEGTERLVGVAFYNVHIYRENVLKILDRDPENDWFSSAEICEGRTLSGETIHPRVVQWINRWDVIQPWQ